VLVPLSRHACRQAGKREHLVKKEINFYTSPPIKNYVTVKLATNLIKIYFK
jgi:hypothetical protein